MLFRRPPDEKPWRDLWEKENRLADALSLPRVLVTCDYCHATAWRMPPHGLGEPCPLFKQYLEDFGLQMDTQRNLALRGQNQAEQMLQRIFGAGHEESEGEATDER